MVISKSLNTPPCNVTVNDDKFEQVDQFSYLGSLITQDSRCDNEIKRRDGISKKKRFTQHGEGTDITIKKYVHENAIAEVLRVVHFIVCM